MRTKIAPRTSVIAANIKATADAHKAVAAARQATADAAERPSTPRVRRAPVENYLDPADRVRTAQGVTLVPPTITGKAVVVRLGDHAVGLPHGLRVAGCKDDPRFVDDGRADSANSDLQPICAACSVLDACRAYARAAPGHAITGYWAGRRRGTRSDLERIAIGSLKTGFTHTIMSVIVWV